jgi:UDP-N-acetylglucosamine 2-epimerase
LRDVLVNLAGEFHARVIVSTHPRTHKRFEERGEELPAEVALMKPFAFSDYVKLQEKVRVVWLLSTGRS